MPALPEQTPPAESDVLEAAADQAIAACSGDMRGAIRALILANEYLEHEVKELTAAVSKGYLRSKRSEEPHKLPPDHNDRQD